MKARVVAVLIPVGILAGVAGVFAVYVRDTIVDSDEFATRAADALVHPVVRELIAKEVVDQIVAAEPDALAVRPLLEPAVSSAVGEPVFRLIYEAAIRDLHRTIFLGQTDTLAVQLADMVLVVKTQASVLSPELSDAIPDELTDTLIDVSANSRAVEVVQVSEEVRLLAFVLPIVALLSFGGAVLLATDRRQALVWVGFGIVGVGVAVLIVEVLLEAIVVRQFEGEEARAVARAFWDAFASDAGDWGLVIAGAGGTTVAAAWWVSEPVDVVARLGQLRRSIDPPEKTSQRIVWVVSWALIGGFLILSWQEATRVVVTLVGVVLLVNAVAEMLRMIAPARVVTPEQVKLAPARQARIGRIGPKSLALGGGLLAVVIVGGYFVVDRSSGEGVVDAPFDPGCNGHVLLCDRRFDDVVIAATHNSMSAAEEGFLSANHATGIIPQLDAGYRGLLIDLHYGLDSDRTPVVVTDRAPPGPEEREQLVRQLGDAAVRSAEQLRQQNLEAGGAREIYLCHGLCELGATRFSSELERIRAWLERNPREVLFIIIQDEVAPSDVADAFEEAGLIGYQHTQALEEPWPTLHQMIDSGRRLVVMAENETGDVSWYHDVFTFVQETPYSFEAVEDFNCGPNRGEPNSPLFMINHWVTPPLATAGDRANSAEVLLDRLEVCKQVRGMSPNILAVDFSMRGDAIEIVARLNGVR